MISERLAAIRARLEAATPGPWSEHRQCLGAESGRAVYESRIIAPAYNIAYHLSRPRLTSFPQDRFTPERSFDADFIANAWSDILFMLNELESRASIPEKP